MLSRIYRAVWPLLLMATLVWSSGGTGPQGVFLFPGVDKVAHVLYFGLLAILVCRVPDNRQPAPRVVLAALLVTALFGFCDESIQAANPHRTFDPYDWLADLTGAVIALALYAGWSPWRRGLETDLFTRTRRAPGDPSMSPPHEHPGSAATDRGTAS